MRDEICPKNREAMLEYLILLTDDSNDAANASHAVILCHMEQGKIQNYQQIIF